MTNDNKLFNEQQARVLVELMRQNCKLLFENCLVVNRRYKKYTNDESIAYMWLIEKGYVKSYVSNDEAYYRINFDNIFDDISIAELIDILEEL